MPPDHAIRRLGPADLAIMRRLNEVFGEAFEDLSSYRNEPPSDEYLAAVLDKPHVAVLAALRGAEVIGGLVAYELDKLERARREIYIYDLAVNAADRRKGVATALIRRLQEIAAERCAWAVFVQADYGDDAAVALYTKLGTREDVMHFDIAPAIAQDAT
jgi:aminoglycoside 3-N-acetyltransferase I